MDLSNKKVIVIGAGISGFAAAKLAKKLGADVILSDANEKLGEKHDLTELTALDIKVVLGKQTEALFEGSDLVIISPAVPRHLPLFEKVAEKVKIISEVEFAYKLAKAPIFAVTGTNGKTTTSFMLKNIYEEAGLKVGIIGTVFVKIDDFMIPSYLTTPESLDLQKYLSISTCFPILLQVLLW